MSSDRDGDEPDVEVDSGLVLRPDVVELEDDALVPDRNLVRPVPTRFTHTLAVDEPYYFDRPERSTKPDGVMSRGTLVAVLVDGPVHSRVVDGIGRYVEVRTASLRAL